MDARLIFWTLCLVTFAYSRKIVPNTKLGVYNVESEERATLLLTRSAAHGHRSPRHAPSRQEGRRLGLIGGLTTDIQDHPYQVAINDAKGFVCSGVLLNKIWILTLASCVDGGQADGFIIRTGSNSDTKGGTIYNVTLMEVHPAFNYTSLDYDVALLKLNTYLCYDNTTNNIKFSFNPPNTDYVGTISGWGMDGVNGKDKFRELTMTVVSTKKCVKDYTVTGDQITNRMFCAEADYQKGPCYNDFGDPFVVNGTLYGLYSWSRGCADFHYPAVFTNVASVKNWIHETMNNALSSCICGGYF